MGHHTRIEHYETAGYMTAISLAEQLGEEEVVKLLNESLAEEQAAEKKLRTIAQTILKSAPQDQEKQRARQRDRGGSPSPLPTSK
jgi:ferritin-like metal-binding protein YciE